jgi:hypothetical protein
MFLDCASARASRAVGSLFAGASKFVFGCAARTACDVMSGVGAEVVGKGLYRVVIPGRWQTGALARDYCTRTVLKCNEQQCKQH